MQETEAWVWAEMEFGRAQLGDERRTRRLVRLAAEAVRRPGGTVTGVVRGGAEREGAFRLLESGRVQLQPIATSSHRATVRRAQGLPFVWVAVDQSTVSVTDRDRRKGLGKIKHSSRRRGLEVMSALAIDPQGMPLGLLGQQWWRRSDETAPSYPQDTRPPEQRESDLWRRALVQSGERLAEAADPVPPWFQLDRGADFWRVWELSQQMGGWVTVRSAHNRRLVGTDQTLWQLVRSKKVAARYTVRVPSRWYRGARRPSRHARLSVRFAPVTLQMTNDQRRPLEASVTAVHVRERRPPQGGERIEWMLLTTRPVRHVGDAWQVVQGYCQRWKIEEFHRTWKAGACQLERSQLRSVSALQRWATILAAVAARVERLKHLARNQPELPASSELSRAEIDAAIVLSRTRKFKPGQDLTLGQAVTLIAEAGGYTGRSSGGPPGSTTIRRGLDQVMTSAEVLQALAKSD